MDKKLELNQLVELALAQCKKLMKEKYVLGAFLLGSAVSEEIHEESDADLAVVYNTVAVEIQVGKEERKIKDVRIKVWRYPITPFIETFEDEKLRNKPDTWMWTSLWIECMQTGLILADPTGRLATWKAKARQWKWRESEIKPAVSQAEENIHASERYLAKTDSFSSLLCLREALTCLSAAHIMKHGSVPSFRPKDLNIKLRLIKDKEEKLTAVFDLANNTSALDYNLVEGLILRLKEFVNAEWGTKRLGPRAELENARSCLHNRDLVGAMLSLRYCAYWLGFHVLNRRGIKTEAEICNAENHVDMANRLATANESYYKFYRELQFAEKWGFEKVKTAISHTQEVLDNWRGSKRKQLKET